MSRASSGHFGKGGAGYFAHNSRENKTKNSIFSTEKNEVSCNAKQAFEIYRQELSKRAEAYTARTNQKLQKNIATHRSLIINLEERHTLEDLKEVQNYLEKSLDTKVLQVAIHKDEGYVDELTNEPHVNYHAHIELMGIDSYGISIAQHQNKINSKTKIKQTRTSRLDSKFYKEFQTFLAKHLQMQRGQKNSKTKRLDTYDYKTAKKNENKTTTPLKLTVKQLKSELELERKRMSEAKIYTKEDYRALSDLKKATNRDNLQDIYLLFLKMKEEHKKLENEQKILQTKNETLQRQNRTLQSNNELLQSNNELLQLKNERIESKNDDLIKENSILKNTIETLEKTVSKLKSKLAESLNDMSKLIKAYESMQNEKQPQPEPEQPQPEPRQKERIVFAKEESKKQRKFGLFKR